MELTEEVYQKLYVSGMFWEYWPECTGNYENDKPIIEEWFIRRVASIPLKEI